MLTDSELAWLKRRQFFNGFYSSGCLTCSLNRTFCEKTDCLLHPDLEDALEFSERVAAKLADIYAEITSEICHVCPVWHLCFGKQDCRTTILKYARLKVEEEMDAD